jgi:hypothetical protein
LHSCCLPGVHAARDDDVAPAANRRGQEGGRDLIDRPDLDQAGQRDVELPVPVQRQAGPGVTDMLAVIRAPPASAALTNGAAAEKSWAAWPPRLATS